jgi:molybdenum cofactor cytidylyltransferase
MRRIATSAHDPTARAAVGGLVCIDVRNPQQPAEVLLRKGRRLTHADLDRMSAKGHVPIVLLVPDGDVDENAAAARIAAALAGPGVGVSTPHQGMVMLRSAGRGFFRADDAALATINANPGVLAFTATDERPVDVGSALAAVKIAPLLLPDRTVRCVEATCEASGPAINVVHVPARQVTLVGTSRLHFRARRRAEDSLRERVGWYGSTLSSEWTLPTRDALLPAFSRARAASDLVLVATAASMDPEDVVFDALRAAGGTVERIGIPIEPGTACWVGRLGTRSVFGLASCELFGSPGAFDVLLPRLLLGEHPDAALLAKLACGGLLLDGPAMIPDYLGAASEVAR